MAPRRRPAAAARILATGLRTSAFLGGITVLAHTGQAAEGSAGPQATASAAADVATGGLTTTCVVLPT